MTVIDNIADDFELLGDWDQRYQYLIELGEKLPVMPENLKTEENKVKGCMSDVWVSAYTDAQDKKHLHYFGDCNTSVIKGVLAILIQMADGKTEDAISQVNADELFERLNLDEHLSPNRHVGVYGIVELMKTQAAQLAQTSSRTASN